MPHKIKILFLITAVLLFWNDLHAQYSESIFSVDCPSEKIMVNLSQESIFTGEILLFNIYCTSSVFQGEGLSSLAFIELVSSENTSAIRKKILLKNGKGSGEFVIPGSLPTGIYYILAYTNWMKNFGETSFFRKEVIIVNPYQPFANMLDSVVNLPEQIDKVVSSFSDNKLKVIPDKNNYSSREKVTMKIETGSVAGKVISGNFSIAVYRNEPQMIFRSGQRKDHILIEEPANKIYMPDYKGIRLSGTLFDPSGVPVSGAKVIAAMPGPGTDIKGCITDSSGVFNFLLKPKEGEQDIVITVPDENTKVSLEEPFWNGFRNPPDNNVLALNKEAITFLKEKFMFFQLQNIFKIQSFIINKPLKSLPDSSVFYVNPRQLIEIKNYIRLDSLREYFYELVPSVKFSQRRGEFDISVIDPLTMTYLNEKPGVFLDGILYDNYGPIAGIPSEKIDRIAVVPSSYFYKDFSFGGIVDIHTKKADFNSVKPLPNMTRFIYPLAYASEWKFSAPEYSIVDSTRRIPDFRFCLYWNSGIRIEKSSAGSVQFYTGDVKGEFIIKVVGITDEGDILQTEKLIYIDD